MSREKRPLTQEEIAEKRRLRILFAECKESWELEYHAKLTQERLGALIGEIINGKPMSQGAIWQYFSDKHPTKLNDKFVLAMAALLGFDPLEVGERFESGLQRDLLRKYAASRGRGEVAEMIHSYQVDSKTPEYPAAARAIPADQYHQVAQYIAGQVSPAESLDIAQYFIDRAKQDTP